MSIGAKLVHADALAIAKDVVEDLKPVCARVKVAGSLRRLRPEVSDIEIVLEPLNATADLFGGVAPDVAAIRAVAERWGVILKGGERYIQVQTAMGVKLDLFLAHPPADWWAILAIRTGPAKLGQWAVTRMHDHGYRCTEGHIERKDTGARVDCASEEDFFRAAGLPCLPPRLRDTADALRPLTPGGAR